jgi:hypothetical protein
VGGAAIAGLLYSKAAKADIALRIR